MHTSSKVLAAGIPVYVSANGVVLSPGNEANVIHKEFWKKAEHVIGGLETGRRSLVWQDGKEVPISEG